MSRRMACDISRCRRMSLRTASRSSASKSRRARKLSASSTLCVRVLAGAAGLAGVVQQQGKEEEIEAVDFREQLRQALLVLVGGRAQGVHVVDDEEGVLVDGVAVVAVADDERVDAVELGNQHLKNAERVHGAQSVRGVRTEQHFAQRVPKVGAFGNGDGQHGQRVGDAVFSGLRERVAVRGHEREDAQDGGSVIELRAGLNVDAALVEEKVGAGDGRAAAAELAIEADRRGQVLHEQRGAAIDDAGMPVVGAHPVAGVGGAAGFQADGAGGGFVLRLPVERVVVAAVAEVEETSGRGEEIEGGFGIAARALEDAAALARPLLGLLEMEKDGEPDGEVSSRAGRRDNLSGWARDERWCCRTWRGARGQFRRAFARSCSTR